MRVTRVFALALTGALLAGCGTSTVPVTTHPRDEETAQDLGATIAEMGRCDTPDQEPSTPGGWTFLCERPHEAPEQYESFEILVYADVAAKQQSSARLNAGGFRCKEGPFFHVIALQPAGLPEPPLRALDDFPGSFPARHP